MATITDQQVPEIFLEIIRKRVADYIAKEIKEMVAKETNKIVSDVLSNLQCEAGMFKSMLRYETQLVVKAIYNGEDIQQKEQSDE